MIIDWQRAKLTLRNACLRVLALALLSAPAAVSGADKLSATSFIKTCGTQFTVDGRPFFVTGVNNHYLTFGSQDEVTRVLDDAVAMGANVVRVFLSPVIGSLDGSTATIWNWRLEGDANDLAVRGTYLLSWNPRENGMAINDGANGMQKVDFLIAEAGKRRLRLIIAFLDFWAYTGGAQQMRAWYGSADQSTFFFNDPRTKRDYRIWVRHVVQRVNLLNGLAYRDDPTIMAWELMNEGNARPEALRLAWIDEMSSYVKSLDSNHLVSSGNANVFEKLADLTIPNLDFGTWHGYPLYYKLTVQQFNDMITGFCHLAARAKKPVLLEEFGYAQSNPDSARAYAMWLNTLTRDPNCAGWIVWRLVSRQDSGRYPVDEHDQFDIRNDGSARWNILQSAAARATQIRKTIRVSEAIREVR
ncbi:glycoside hydrolase 5 family protein [Mesorhizobium sp. B1-1-8]|uniref:glycoside hydrolase 5 family protein n=1 Tax=Mesorhizobium sp. B1-1-8 TaxID=2589976 RepID=UPI001129C226|nr:cellulase family glycosylhydrolase [Mesorhizobium sp. B1-1-8]UCI10455.1 cellulase family glycosylhydrolase [Mesorhizobium sp. B1-1-8]